MSRKRKPPELHPVDEAAEKEKGGRYFRLDPEQGPSDEQQVLKLEASSEPEQKLEVPVREDVETRANEPGVEVLIDAELPSLEGLESDWGNDSKERRPIPWGWFALIGLIVMGGAAWSLRHIWLADEQLEILRIETETILGSEEESVAQARSLVERIEASVIDFCTAPDIDSMLRVVRHPDRVRPLMDDHYSRHSFEPFAPSRIESLRPLTLGTHGNFWMATVELEGGEKKYLLVQADEDERPLVDWETAVCYQPMEWDDYVRERPPGSTLDFRVYLEPDLLYSHEFRDSSQWTCYKLTALDSDEMLYGYVRADSPTAELLRIWFRRHPGDRATMIMRLSIPEGLTSPRGVVIDHGLSVRWIYIAPPVSG